MHIFKYKKAQGILEKCKLDSLYYFSIKINKLTIRYIGNELIKTKAFD